MNNLRKTIEFLGLDYKKEMRKLFVYNIAFLLLAVLFFLMNKGSLVFVISLVGLIGLNYFLISSYTVKKKELIKDHSNEFIYVISFFRIFLSNKHNVYQSFRRLFDYSSDWMKEKLEKFLSAIDEDKSVKPFTDFASEFDLHIARNVLISIYQMVEQGETNEQLNQFTILFEQMNKTLTDEKKEKKARSFDLVSMFPLLGAGLVTLALTFGIIGSMEDMINVI